MIRLENVSIAFPSVDGEDTLAVENCSFSVEKGGFVSLIGPSGCGKTSLLNAMAGLAPLKSGSITFGDISAKNRLGYISQSDRLLPFRTLLDNVALGLEIQGEKKLIRREKAAALLETMGLWAFRGHYPHELSGGMKKRASIAQILAIEPQILFMDEPFAPLDAFLKEQLQDEILMLWEKYQQTIVYVTHDITEALSLSQKVLVLGEKASIKGEFSLTLPYPRKMREMKFHPTIMDFEKEIWGILGGAVKAEGGQNG